jgi:hypothetical protein
MHDTPRFVARMLTGADFRFLRGVDVIAPTRNQYFFHRPLITPILAFWGAGEPGFDPRGMVLAY